MTEREPYSWIVPSRLPTGRKDAVSVAATLLRYARPVVAVLLVTSMLSCSTRQRPSVRPGGPIEIPVAVLVEPPTQDYVIVARDICQLQSINRDSYFNVKIGSMFTAALESKLRGEFRSIRRIDAAEQAVSGELIVRGAIRGASSERPRMLGAPITTQLDIELELLTVDGAVLKRIYHPEEMTFDPRTETNLAKGVLEMASLIANFTFVATVATGKSVHDLVVIQREYNLAGAQIVDRAMGKAVTAMLADPRLEYTFATFRERGQLPPALQEQVGAFMLALFPEGAASAVVSVLSIAAPNAPDFIVTHVEQLLRQSVRDIAHGTVVDPELQQRILRQLSIAPVAVLESASFDAFTTLSSVDWVVAAHLTHRADGPSLAVDLWSADSKAIVRSHGARLYDPSFIP